MKQFEFGNFRFQQRLRIGENTGIKLLANLGHMDEAMNYDDELRKASIAVNCGVDILADNSVTKKSFDFKRWIKANLPVMLNTVPIYDCFDAMENGTFEFAMLEEAIDKHIEVGADMMVFHPTLTAGLRNSVEASSRIIKVTSRGGSQMYRYLGKGKCENPYYEYWDDLCNKLSNKGIAIAIGLSLRSGSVVDDCDDLFMQELDIAGDLVLRAHRANIPVVVEGMGHIRDDNMVVLFSEVKKRCHGVPIKTLGPLLSDRMIGMEHINALLGSYSAAKAGASIIGALFRSEHLGLPSVEEYEESLMNYKLLKYILNMTPENLEIEKMISEERSRRNWSGVLKHAYFQSEAQKQFHLRYGECTPDTCTMCGKRCAMRS